MLTTNTKMTPELDQVWMDLVLSNTIAVVVTVDHDGIVHAVDYESIADGVAYYCKEILRGIQTASNINYVACFIRKDPGDFEPHQVFQAGGFDQEEVD
jgi:hypothetical protein